MRSGAVKQILNEAADQFTEVIALAEREGAMEHGHTGAVILREPDQGGYRFTRWTVHAGPSGGWKPVDFHSGHHKITADRAWELFLDYVDAQVHA